MYFAFQIYEVFFFSFTSKLNSFYLGFNLVIFFTYGRIDGYERPLLFQRLSKEVSLTLARLLTRETSSSRQTTCSPPAEKTENPFSPEVFLHSPQANSTYYQLLLLNEDQKKAHPENSFFRQDPIIPLTPSQIKLNGIFMNPNRLSLVLLPTWI